MVDLPTLEDLLFECEGSLVADTIAIRAAIVALPTRVIRLRELRGWFRDFEPRLLRWYMRLYPRDDAIGDILEHADDMEAFSDLFQDLVCEDIYPCAEHIAKYQNDFTAEGARVHHRWPQLHDHYNSSMSTGTGFLVHMDAYLAKFVTNP